MGVQPVTVTDNTYMMWQTIVAVMTVVTIGVGWFGFFSKKMKLASDNRKTVNSAENAQILAAVNTLTARLDAHIDHSAQPHAESHTTVPR
jgi:hypothetical protein